MRVFKLSLAVAVLASVGCASKSKQINYDSLAGSFEASQQLSIDSIDEASKARGDVADKLKGIEDVAIMFGVNQGMIYRTRQLNSTVEEMATELAVTYNFHQLLIDGMYLPPRVQVMNGHSEAKDGYLRNIRLSYKIVSAPVLVTEPPNFLNYLWQDVPDYQAPNPGGLPRRGNKVERKVWADGFVKGWGFGIKQADIGFEEDQNALVRDFHGMMRYIDLVSKGIINKPKIVSQNFGIAISTDGKTVNVGDEVFFVGEDAVFQSAEKWKSLIGIKSGSEQ